MEIYQITYGFRGHHYNEYFMTLKEAEKAKKEMESNYIDLVGFVALLVIEDVPTTKKGVVVLLNSCTSKRIDFINDLEEYSESFKEKGLA
tara:strand:+ start:413 stop:682 length:270 start_codon:yes stop_codon:yes gene_type:complete